VALDASVVDSPDECDERIRAVLKLMDGLPSKQQIILRMKHIEGLECEQIAQIVGVSIDAVYQNLCRARRAILKEFKQRNYEE
jgi:RNA polymerase sigma-70 factor (ECF subfamily)